MNEKTSLLTVSTDSSTLDDAAGGPLTTSSRVSVALQTKYPPSFFDPVTNELMKDPVVAPSGVSYERSSWKALCQNHAEPSAPAYTNRALRQIIQETIVEKNTIRQGNFRRSSRVLGLKVQQTVRRNISKIMDKSILPTADRKTLSEAYYCPITMLLIREPVIGPEGFSFEKDAMEQWIDKNQVSPLTRTPLPSKRLLYHNRALRDLLRWEISNLDQQEEDQSQSIRDFRLYLETEDQEKGQANASYDGPQTMEQWKALRNRQRQTNAQCSCSGLLQFFYLILVLVFGVVIGIVMGIVALFLATVLDIVLAPILQCFCPGGCYGNSDPFGDDEVPFIVYPYDDGDGREEGERIEV